MDGHQLCFQEGNNNNNSYDKDDHDDEDAVRMDVSTIEMDKNEDQLQEQDHGRSHHCSRLNLETSTCHASIGRENCGTTAMMIIDNAIDDDFAASNVSASSDATSAAVLFNPEHERFDSDALSCILSFLDLAALTNLQATSKKLLDTVALATTQLFVPVSYLNHRHHRLTTTSSYKYRGGLYEQQIVLPLDSSAAGSERSGPPSSSPPASKTPQDQLRCLLRRYPNLTFLAIDRVAPVGDEVIQIINECPSRMTLTSLSLSNLALSYWCRHSLHLPNLKHLSLTGNSVRARIVNVIRDTTVYQNLQCLCIQDCNTAIRDDDMIDLSRQVGHSLKTLQMRNAKLSNPQAYFPRLENLKLCGCFHLKSLSNFDCPNLVELNLSFCVKLTGQSISSFIEPPSPSQKTERMKNLKSLVLMKCLQDSLVISTGDTNLSCIKIDFCHNLKNVQLVCPNLSVFEVSTGSK